MAGVSVAAALPQTFCRKLPARLAARRVGLGMVSRNSQSIFDLADALNSPPSGGKAQMWIAGVMLAAISFAYGLFCCVTMHAKTINITLRGFPLLGQGPFLDILGGAAFSMGAIFVFAGLFMHFQWFWGNHPRLSDYYELGKYGSVVGIIGALVAHVYYILS